MKRDVEESTKQRREKKQTDESRSRSRSDNKRNVIIQAQVVQEALEKINNRKRILDEIRNNNSLCICIFITFKVKSA